MWHQMLHARPLHSETDHEWRSLHKKSSQYLIQRPIRTAWKRTLPRKPGTKFFSSDNLTFLIFYPNVITWGNQSNFAIASGVVKEENIENLGNRINSITNHKPYQDKKWMRDQLHPLQPKKYRRIQLSVLGDLILQKLYNQPSTTWTCPTKKLW